jgi:hypothetical protein
VQATDSSSNTATKSLSIVVAVVIGGFWVTAKPQDKKKPPLKSPLRPWFNAPRRG